MAVTASTIIVTQRSSDNLTDTRVSLASTANSLIGQNASGVPAVVNVSTGLSLSGGNLTATGTGTVTSVSDCHRKGKAPY